MSTSFNSVYDLFLNEIETDSSFIDYVNLSERESLELAMSRCKNLLIESISELTSKCTPDINFLNYDVELETLNVDLTINEKKLLSTIMFKNYMGRDIPKLKTFVLNYIPSEMTVFSPANERNSYMALMKDLELKVNVAIDKYASRDRLTGKRKSIDFSSYTEE